MTERRECLQKHDSMYKEVEKVKEKRAKKRCLKEKRREARRTLFKWRILSSKMCKSGAMKRGQAGGRHAGALQHNQNNLTWWEMCRPCFRQGEKHNEDKNWPLGHNVQPEKRVDSKHYWSMYRWGWVEKVFFSACSTVLWYIVIYEQKNSPFRKKKTWIHAKLSFGSLTGSSHTKRKHCPQTPNLLTDHLRGHPRATGPQMIQKCASK